MADRITIRITPEIGEALDRFRAEQFQSKMSRQEAFRQITNDWLMSQGYLGQTSSTDTSPPSRSSNGDVGVEAKNRQAREK